MPLDDLVTALIFVNRGRSGHPRVGVAKAKGSGIAQMAYCQAVNGEYYSGDYEKMFLRQRSAQKFADELKGRPAFIRHKASAPEVSTLLPEDQQTVWPLRDKG